MTKVVIDRYGDDIKKGCPLNRFGRPEEMAGIALYLSSRAGGYTSGAVITVGRRYGRQPQPALTG
jgi:NAD(P)-dependent dehydrogenase (short-subunit alcohol dehydrogenase family)